MAVAVSARLVTGYWDTQSGDPATAPGSGKYRADDWAAPTLYAISGQDADGYDRQAGLASIAPGDLLTQLATNDSQNFLRFTVAAVADLGDYVALGVTLAEAGAAFTPPGSNQRRLLEVLHLDAPGGGAPAPPWVPWAPPLDPPTAGGLSAATAEAIAAATWDTDPHLCAALQWEAYAAQLPAGPSVSQVATGVQSVTYSPPMPGGDAGAAMAKAAWHRSLMGNGGSPELVLSPPARQTVPVSPWAFDWAAWNWWPVA